MNNFTRAVLEWIKEYSSPGIDDPDGVADMVTIAQSDNSEIFRENLDDGVHEALKRELYESISGDIYIPPWGALAHELLSLALSRVNVDEIIDAYRKGELDG